MGTALGLNTCMALACVLATPDRQLTKLDISHNNIMGVSGQCLLREMRRAALSQTLHATARHCIHVVRHVGSAMFACSLTNQHA